MPLMKNASGFAFLKAICDASLERIIPRVRANKTQAPQYPPKELIAIFEAPTHF
jgi:hypothetical protein